MIFNEKDIKRGYAICDQDGCNKKHILDAGTDYDDKDWILCEQCNCFVVRNEDDKHNT